MSTDRGINVENLTAAAKMVQGVIKPLVGMITMAVPHIIRGSKLAYAAWVKLPKNVVRFITGFIFCFFGGVFPVLFAAVQAAEYGGRKKVVEAVGVLADEAMKIIEASQKDDQIDADNDGIKDVKEISDKEFIVRKFNLVMTKMDPQKVDSAIASIYRVWLSVIAVISIQFARTIALALTISDFFKKPINKYIAPTIELAVPVEYKRWVPVVIGWITKAFAMSIAWYVQSVISAFTSALAGGLMMARAVFDYCVHHQMTLGGWIPEKQEDSNLDEMLSYVFAATGVYIQIMNNFAVPFPFNLVLWPLKIAEYYLRWTITKATK